jgi:phosphohistidine phosphatase
MRRLILLRHGKAESVSATGGDFDRGLTDRGRRDCGLIGRVLADAGVVLDLALVSAARRTQETWEEISRAFPVARGEIVRGLYLAAPKQISAAVNAVGEGLNVLVIGHNPGLHECALALAAAAGEPLEGLQSFPTAAAAVFRLDAAGGVVLERVLLPREYGGGPT